MPKKKTEVRKSDCDDGMFMQSEIILTYTPGKLNVLELDIELQSGHKPAYLRKGEIKNLIDNLQYFYDAIPDK